MPDYAVSETGAALEAEKICALWSRNLGFDSAAHAAAKLEHGYVSNPAGAGALFAVRHEAAEPASPPTSAPASAPAPAAGFIGLHPRRFVLGERELAAATLADFAVDREHRSLGPALMLMRAALRTGQQRYAFVYGMPNPDSRALLRRAGMTPLGAMRRYTLVISSRPKLEHRLPRAGVRVLAPLLAPVLDLALRARAAWLDLRARPALRCRAVSFDDAGIDRVWAQRPGALLLSDRSSSMLRWRYARTSTSSWRIALAQDASGRDAGHVAWQLDAGLARIGDFFSTDPPHETAALLLAFARHAREAGAHTVTASFLGDPIVTQALSSAGFFLSDPEGEPVFVAREPMMGEVPLTRWYLTSFDNDDD